MQTVLLLNASFEPLKIISWQRAITLFFSGKVEVIEEYDHNIRSVSLAIRAPSVIRLLKYVRIGQRTPPLNRANVLARDMFQCQYCQKFLYGKSEDTTLDHVIPRSRGGKTSWSNVVCCCKKCNLKKGSNTPEEAGMALLNKPRQPDWLPILSVKFHGRLPSQWQNFLQGKYSDLKFAGS